ncbi:VanZ family protein [Poseidonocella sp. HB161398]|uniref:VanZ family protein n=1 Tax=Poseidonocella sp. HB161398 TaxID=2320855 RepID=UPI0011090EE0|nr:VanZ family protein [Poseidonocella sp. HB161398]
METGAIAAYLGGALAMALGGVFVLALLLAGLRALSGRSLRAGAAEAGLALAALFAVFLGLSPFPDPAALDCTGGGPAPILRPFAFLDTYRRLWAAGRPLEAWLSNRGAVSAPMNAVLFAPIGLALAWRGGGRRAALAWALGLPLFIELAQLSALFGLYPCRYRHFEVDDLILNGAGILAGHALGQGLSRKLSRRSAR